jgi:hypothetical protein
MKSEGWQRLRAGYAKMFADWITRLEARRESGFVQSENATPKKCEAGAHNELE